MKNGLLSTMQHFKAMLQLPILTYSDNQKTLILLLFFIHKTRKEYIKNMRPRKKNLELTKIESFPMTH